MNNDLEFHQGLNVWGEDARLFWKWRGVIDYFERSKRTPDLIMDVFTKLDIPIAPPSASFVPSFEKTFLDEVDDYSDYDDERESYPEWERNHFHNWEKPKPAGISLETIGGSSFSYEGSVEKGTSISYGSGSRVKASKELYQELLKTFSGQTIILGNPPKEENDLTYLRNWLLANNHPRILKHHIPSILMAEGYAELAEESLIELQIKPYEKISD
ncbi:hypothetical protein AM500_06020 [Bacillus sp. FJAT-18017]|uniref:hypothetical protein n=1 Tax=Bacillus sp. FJAT-18017 TaxID=1705566 RepID=UPI0006AF1154|nr:hypothetical protein [Bacillus sp. FJAT-18017]ALC89390.1 hypothetical protein AM500_06020 [Bacillus sp. FJAT-18017]